MKRSLARDQQEDPEDVKSTEKLPDTPNITWQHVWPQDEARNALSQSLFASLPNEILLRIFKYLSVSNLCDISLVCRLFKMIADQDDIWKCKCNTSTKLYSKSFKQIYMDWIYLKCLRNTQLKRNCLGARTACRRSMPPPYPVRPVTKPKSQIIGGFSRHPNSSSSMVIQLSVDIEKTARELIKLLEKASQFQQQQQQQYQNPCILKQMITRYYQFMTLKASHPSNILLIPTLDIEIVWQTHLLRPEMYRTDCLRLFHRVIDHSLLMVDLNQFLKDQAFHDTCQLYEQRFGQQYCPLSSTGEETSSASSSDRYLFDATNETDFTYSYWDKTCFDFSSSSPKDYENPFSFTEGDLVMDSQWLGFCKQFMSDALNKAPVDDYHRRFGSAHIDVTTGSINRLKKSYERFLYMAAKYPLKDGHDFVPPTYAIDIMWHSHMQEPLNYISDCHRLVGYVIQHDPWPKVEDQAMKKASNRTDQMWKDEFEADLMTDHLFNTISSRP